MKKHLLLTCCLAALMSVSAWADNNQTITLSGETLDNTVTQITFSGNTLKLHFKDGTEQLIDDVSTLKIAFSVVDAIRTISSERQSDTVQVFDMQGKLVSNVRSTEASDCLNGLQKGIYIVRKGNKTVKLIKN